MAWIACRGATRWHRDRNIPIGNWATFHLTLGMSSETLPEIGLMGEHLLRRNMANRRKIFLSSTYVDLHDVRQELHRWLTEIFGAHLVIMESFGSDAEPPNVMSVRRVRDCETFIGLYAHRYGTIDSDTGRSITELELDEARTAHSAGIIKNILLYAIADESPWLSDLKDTNVEADSGRARLREKLSRHTYTPFKTELDLIFSVVRDVHRIIAPGFPSDQRIVKSISIPSERKITRPIGMEFLTSGDRQYLIGRQGV